MFYIIFCLICIYLSYVYNIEKTTKVFIPDPEVKSLRETKEEFQRDAYLFQKRIYQYMISNPITHHRNEYKFTGHTTTNKFFNSLEGVLNPIFYNIIQKRYGQTLYDTRSFVLRHMVQMRDGIHLSTVVVVPSTSRRVSTILARSPYGPTSDLVSLLFTKFKGYAAVIQDQRGTFLSEGNFSLWRLDATDGYDTMEWIEKQEWSNGKVYSIGISADGCGALTQVISKPKQLKGQLIMWASADGHATVYPGGAFREGLIAGWMALTSPLTRGHSLKYTLPEILEHEEMSPWWSTIVATPEHYKNIAWPEIHIAAWWDIFQGHQLDAFDNFRNLGPKELRDKHVLIVGPLGHCILGKGSLWSDPEISITKHNFEQEAKGIINGYGYALETFDERPNTLGPYAKKLKNINIFVQDPVGGGYWSSFKEWPSPRTYKLYASPNNTLRESPQALKQVSKQGSEEFTYNPLNPTITHGGNNLILMFLGLGCGSMDQTEHEKKSDVLVFTSTVLQENLAIVGKIKAVLHISTNRNDTDFHVTLTDVFPDNRSMLVRYGIQRMKWRNNKKNQRLIQNKIYEVEIHMWRTAYIFNKGHRIRIAISSSNTPYYSKNKDTGDDRDNNNIFTDDPDKEFPALNKIHWDAANPSYIELPVVDMEQIPINEEF